MLIAGFILLNVCLKASGPDDLSLNTIEDREQQQLHWCFIYSNMLGFNIDYVNNPRLYQSISEWSGTPYKYSGSSKKGVDCSGLVCKLYLDSYDKVMNGCARDMFKSTDPIKRSDLREGDLVFFKIKKNRVSHVGIYLTQNRFVHSSTTHGVIVSTLDDPYYNRYFYKGGRIKND